MASSWVALTSQGVGGLKIVVVGAGSTYTPELVGGLAARQHSLKVSELVLLDPARDRLDVVAAFAARILHDAQWPGRITASTDLDSALDGADAVLVQLRVGGQQARLHDETVPLACGCLGQETTGAGGLGKALRTVPVVLDLAEEVRRRAAGDAWIIDFTNPVGIVTRALRKAGHRAIGLCNVAIGLQRVIAGMLGAEPGRVLVDQVGLNHLTWIRRVLLDGTDVLPVLLEQHADALAAHVELPVELLRELGAVPSYYLRYYYAHDTAVAEQRIGPPRAAQVQAIESELLRLYRDPALTSIPALLEQRGGAYYSEAAAALLASLVTGDGAVHEVDMPNDGLLAGLAPDDGVGGPPPGDPSPPHPPPPPPPPPRVLGPPADVARFQRVAA